MEVAMARVAGVLVAVCLVLAGCGGGDSVFDSPTTSEPTTTSEGGTDPDGDGTAGSDLLPPGAETIVETGAWGRVFDRRIVVRLADGTGPAAADEVAAAVGGTVVGRIEDFLIAEIELADPGEGALAAALATLEGRVDVAIAAPSSVIAPAWGVSEVPCGPLDSLVLQAEDRGDQYSLIGVEDAWRLVRGSGVTITKPSVGIVDGFGSQVGYHGSWVQETADATSGAGNPPGVLDAILGDGAASITSTDVFGTSQYTSVTPYLSGVKRLISPPNNATVVNLSLGGVSTPAEQALVRQFLRDLAISHPQVLVVAAAGNDATDLASWAPGGLSEPNLVTVGGLNHQGERWLETWTDAAGVQHTVGSNYVASGGEVTLSAIAQDVFTGMGSSGSPVVQSGTSFAAPQATAAAAILQALDPTLTAAEIKQILVDTAATEIANPDINDRITTVDPALGGRVLRVDNAVWKVLSERLGVTSGREAVMGRATLRVRARVAEDDPLTFRIVATAPGGGDAAVVQIAVNGPGLLTPGGETLTTDDDVARWRWGFLSPGESAQATLTRTDTGACARVVMSADESAPSFAGDYEGTFDWTIAEAGFATTVPFAATITGEGAVDAGFDWSGVYDYGGGVQAQLSLTGSCSGTVDDQGVVECSGEFMGRSSVAGVGVDNPGTFTVDATIDAEGTMTGTITAVSPLGGSGVFDLRGARVGG